MAVQLPLPKKTLVGCVGNILLLDEGLGPHVARVLTHRDAALEYFDEEHTDLLMSLFREDQIEPGDDPRIPVLDAGTMGMSMIPYIRDYERIVFIDVIDCGDDSGVEPGTVYVLTPEDMAEHAIMHSLHDMRLIDVIDNANLAGYDCDISCVCVQKQDIDPKDFVIDLTPKVKASIPVVVGTLLEELGLEL